MMCFKDMTFCEFWKECKKGKECHRALNDDVEKRADKWWGKGEGTAPICVFLDKPDCFEGVKK